MDRVGELFTALVMRNLMLCLMVEGCVWHQNCRGVKSFYRVDKLITIRLATGISTSPRK